MSAEIRRPGRGFLAVCLAGLLLILIARLIPFTFAYPGHIPWERVTWQPLNTADIPVNLVLFIPFSFGLAGVLAARGWTGRRHLWATLLICAGLSTLLEVTQIFMPDRVPSVLDVASNTFSALLGYGLYQSWLAGFGATIDRFVTARNLLIALGCYTIAVIALTTYLYWSAGLSNWDDSYPLMIGNEITGRRSWWGSIDQLYFLNHTVTDEEATAALAGRLPDDLLSLYEFDGDGPYVDQQGTLPQLEWQTDAPVEHRPAGVVISREQWLATPDPAGAFSSALADSFTVGLTVAADRDIPSGPARIVSVSSGYQLRNLTIGQQDSDLIIRLRTPSGGENGQRPELVVPGVFSEKHPLRLVVSYRRPLMRVFVEGRPEPYEFSLAPGAAMMQGFITGGSWLAPMVGNAHRFDRLYWSVVVGIPALLGIGLVATKQVRRRQVTQS